MALNAKTFSLAESFGSVAVLLSGLAVGAIVWRAWPFFRRAVGREPLAAASPGENIVPSDGRARYDVFDGLRGMLCLFVLVHHVEITRHLSSPIGSWRLALEAAPVALMPRGASTVIFFAMTAFLFYARQLQRPRPFDSSSFFARRAWRLGPALLLSAVLMVLVELLPGTPKMMSLPDAGRLAVTALSLGSLGFWFFPQNAGVLWTLAYEWLFYLVFPLFAYGINRRVRPAAMIAAAFLCAAIGAGVLGRFYCFAYPAGVVAAYLHDAPAVRRLASQWGGSLVVVLLGVGITVAAAHLPHPERMPFIVAAACGMFTLIAAGNDVFGILRLPAVRAVGVASYSVYLFHGIALYAFRDVIIRQARADEWLGHVTVCAITMGVVLISFFSYRYVEHVGVEIGRRFLKKKPTPPPAAAPAKGDEPSPAPAPAV